MTYRRGYMGERTVIRCAADVFLLLSLTSTVYGQSVKLPETVKVEVGRLASVKIEYDGDEVKWTVAPQLDSFREYDPDAKVVRLRLIGYVRGSYEVKAVTCKDKKLSDFAVCVIVIGDGPTPPIPPVPPPTPPDQLTSLISEALRFETDADKVQLKNSLAALYRQGAVTANDLRILTWGQLFTTMQQDATARQVRGKLLKVQTVIAAHLNENLPNDPNRSLAAERAKAAEVFLKVAVALEAAKE